MGVCSKAENNKNMFAVVLTKVTEAHLWMKYIRGDHTALLEAVAIAGYAVGANQGYIIFRAEYPIAVNRLNIAIESAKSMVF